jgi:hypothetical protein
LEEKMRVPTNAFAAVLEAMQSADESVERLKSAIRALLPAGYSVTIEEQGTLPSTRYPAKFRRPLRMFKDCGVTISYGDWSRWLPSISELLEGAVIGIGGRIAGWEEGWPTEEEVAVRRTQEDCRRAGLRYRNSGTPGLQFVNREDIAAGPRRLVSDSNAQVEVAPLADKTLLKGLAL